jgi:stage III sporulation protein AA
MRELLEMLPMRVQEILQTVQLDDLEEIRMRVQRPLECSAAGCVKVYPHVVTTEDAMQLLNRISQFSIYTLEEELRRGYITIRGGHRIGLAGRVVTEKGFVKLIRDVSSFNIRIARQKLGIAEPLLSYVYENNWKNTMIVGPPQTGKTTLLRDFARIISIGHKGIPSAKVGIVDERSEIAGSVKGVPQYELGVRVDVLDACPKAEGMMMLIRSMSPEIVIADEVGREEDVEAILEAVYAGVGLFITAHGYGYEDVKKRPSLRKMIEYGVFDRVIELSKTKGPGTIVAVKTGQGQMLRVQGAGQIC